MDDILIAAKSIDTVTSVKEALLATFDARDLGDVNLFLSMAITRDRAARTIKLAQPRMIDDLLDKYGMSDAKPKATPLTPSATLSRDDGPPLNTQVCTYAALIGSLNYLAVCTRPDIAQAVGALARYMDAPTEAHWSAAKGVLRYLHGTRDMGIVYGNGMGLQGYCDADYASDVDSRRSTTAYVFTLYGGAITWASRRQPTIAASTTEAEFMAAAAATKEALWLRHLLSTFGFPALTIHISGDNQAALALLKNPLGMQRAKHIDVLHRFARERVSRKEVAFSYCPTDRMMADALTKAVPAPKHSACCAGLGIA